MVRGVCTHTSCLPVWVCASRHVRCVEGPGGVSGCNGATNRCYDVTDVITFAVEIVAYLIALHLNLSTGGRVDCI